MSITIALAGNPNSGKTTLFNFLTGSSQYVGNWPGVTVEKKAGKMRLYKDVQVVDLPGIYSLAPYSPEEVVSRRFLLEEKPDCIINIVDGMNLERNLYLTTQLLELRVPVLVALNMADLLAKRGDTVNKDILGKLLGCEVMEIAALKGTGCKELADRAVLLAEKKKLPAKKILFSGPAERAVSEIEQLLAPFTPEKRFWAVKVFERDKNAGEALSLPSEAQQKAEALTVACEKELEEDSESIITNERYQFVGEVVAQSVIKGKTGVLSTSDKIDRVVTNRWLALPFFSAVMFLVYYLAINTVGAWGTGWINERLFGTILPPAVTGWMLSAGSPAWLVSLTVNGVLGGLGAVLGFLPQMLVLFFLLALLEDSGYMARIAFIMDRIFRKFGLSGKSFIPMLVGTGCGVPGIMASRTIESARDRKMTIMTTTFMPCSAKLPIIALFAGALFPKNPLVAPSAYFAGIAAIVFSGIVLKKFRFFAGEPAPFVMELPPYRLPGAKGLLQHTYDRGKSFVLKAGSIIFLAVLCVWFLSSFSWRFTLTDIPEQSMLASLGRLLAPLFAPLGFGNWQAAMATVTGLVAKENVVGTYGVLHGLAEAAETDTRLMGYIAQSFTPLSAYSFLLFNLLCAPCFAAIGAIRREMGGAKWTFITIGYQTLLAYAISLCTYQLGLLFTGGIFTPSTAAGMVTLAIALYLFFRKAPRYENARAGAAPHKRHV